MAGLLFLDFPFCFFFLIQRLLRRTRLSNSMLLLKLPILLNQGVDTVDHSLDQLHLGVAETVLVGDVVSDSCLTP